MAETKTDMKKAAELRKSPLKTPSDLGGNAVRDLSGALNELLADVFALYMKTKNFHWHVSGPHFRDYHLLLDEQAGQILAMTDPIAERVRKLGGTTLRSIGNIARLQRVKDNDADYVDPEGMLAELRDDNKDLVTRMRSVHDLTDEGPHVERELALIKMAGTGEKRIESLRLADIFRAKAIDSTIESFVFEITGSPEKIDAFINLMEPLGLVDVSRTGVVAISRGPAKF